MNKIALVLVVFLVGCGQKKLKEESDTTFVDGRGREVVVPQNITKAVGLSPAVTEMLFFVTDGKKVAARTQNDTYPEKVNELPIIVNYPKLDIERLLSFKPDVVFAEMGINPEPELKKLEDYGVKVFWLDVQTIDQLIENLTTIDQILDQGDSESKINRLKNKLRALANNEVDNKPTALVLASVSPMYVHGYNTLTTEKLKLAGFENAVTSTFPGEYPEITREYLLTLNPDYILGYSFEKMDSTYFTIHPEMKRLKAYQAKHIFELQADLTSRPGPRILESILEMRQCRLQ